MAIKELTAEKKARILAEYEAGQAKDALGGFQVAGGIMM